MCWSTVGGFVEVVPGGRSSARCAPRSSATEEVVDLAGGLLAPGFTDAHVHPIQGGLERLRCDLSEHATREDYLAAIAAYAAAHPDVEWILGGGWAMPAFPAARRWRPTSTPWCRTARCSCPTATTTAPGSTRGRSSSPASTATPRTRPTAGSSATPTATRPAPCTRARRRWSPGTCPGTTGDDYHAALLAGQAYLHSLGVTSWQDAIVGSYSGMDDPASTYVDGRGERRPRGRTSSARCGGTGASGVEQVADLVGRREALTGGRFRATSVKIMQDGVAENGTAAMLEPYLDRCGHPTDNSGHSFVDAGALRDAVAALDAAGFQVHVHAIGDRGGPRDARRVRRPTRPGPPPPDRAPAAGPPRRRAAVRRARRRRQHAGAVGLPRRPDGRPDAAVPRGRSGRAGSTRSATCTAPAPGWSPAATGRSRRPTRWPRSTSRSPGRRTASRAGPAPSRSCPSRRWTSRPRSRRTPRAARG